MRRGPEPDSGGCGADDAPGRGSYHTAQDVAAKPGYSVFRGYVACALEAPRDANIDGSCFVGCWYCCGYVAVWLYTFMGIAARAVRLYGIL